MDRRTFLLRGALLTTGVMAGAARLRPPARIGFTPASALPDKVGDWRSFVPEDVILPQEDALTGRLYDALVIKSYSRKDRAPITAVLAYGAKQDYAFQMHRPEVCYPASGFWLRALERRQLSLAGQSVPGNIMLAKRGRRQEAVLFWTRIGNAFPQSLSEQRIAVLANAGQWQAAEGILMRLSVQGGELAADAAALERFAAELVSQAGADGRRLFLGP